MRTQFEIVTADKVRGPYSVQDLPHAIASLPDQSAIDDEAPGRGVRVVGCEDSETPH